MKLNQKQHTALLLLAHEGQNTATAIGLFGDGLNDIAWGGLVKSIGTNAFGHPIYRITDAGRKALEDKP